MVMSKKKNYKGPRIMAFGMEARKVFCGSNEYEMKFGGDNEAGSIENGNIVNGGSF